MCLLLGASLNFLSPVCQTSPASDSLLETAGEKAPPAGRPAAFHLCLMSPNTRRKERSFCSDDKTVCLCVNYVQLDHTLPSSHKKVFYSVEMLHHKSLNSQIFFKMEKSCLILFFQLLHISVCISTKLAP